MHDGALYMISAIRKKWIVASLLSQVLLAVAVSLLPAFTLHRLFAWPLWSAGIFFMLSLLILLFVDQSWRITQKEVARYLNKTYPSLEESCELLLRDPSTLNSLEALQANKTAMALQQIAQPSLLNKLKISWLTAVIAGVVCWLLSFVLYPFAGSVHKMLPGMANEKNVALPPGVSRIDIRIVPPPYTHRPAREQKTMNLEVEEGAVIHWGIKLQSPASNVKFVYNDSLAVSLHADAAHSTWTTDKTVTTSGFYQLKIDSTVSELYKIEVTKDQPPVIVISSPKPTTVIEYGDPQKINLQTIVSDDYGVKEVTINATVAKGSGEGVKFKTQQMSFGASFAAQQKQYELQKMIGLAALGMEPGDELYFYIGATDNHGQEKRSDIYIVSITDTARLMSMDGLLNGVNLKPDYFRSQRQIIIETEQLIKEKDTIALQNFNNRSNNLGIDQKLLRLRYGKFLGEEASSNDDISGDNGLGNPADFGNASVILDAFTDKHDNAEDATFLDPETKKQLKATLTEMWNAELRLRTYKPQEALAYEYKALRLLKDLQQRSRAYVAKTSIKTAPIKPEKRLTGKLDQITGPVTHANLTPAADPVEELRNALSVLEQVKKNRLIDERSVRSLRLATALVSEHAAKEPAVYLGALEAMKKIITASQNGQASTVTDIITSQKALQKIAGIPSVLPSRKQSVPALSLSEQYYRNLQKNARH